MKKLLILIILFIISPVVAQTPNPTTLGYQNCNNNNGATNCSWIPIPNGVITTFAPVLITTGLTYQQILPVLTNSTYRHSLTIQNNNAADSCELLIVGTGNPFLVGDTTTTSRSVNGISMTALQASIVLSAGQSYTRYFPLAPADQILATCATTGDSLYVDTQ